MVAYALAKADLAWKGALIFLKKYLVHVLHLDELSAIKKLIYIAALEKVKKHLLFLCVVTWVHPYPKSS